MLTFTPIYYTSYTGDRSVRFILTTRNTPEKKTLKKTLHLLVNLKNLRVLVPPMLFSIERWRQCQPLIFPPIQASNRALRSVTLERRNVVKRVRDCRMTKVQE